MTEKTPACCRCRSCNVEPLCHELPDPQFICNECLQEMGPDGSAWIKPVVLTIDNRGLRGCIKRLSDMDESLQFFEKAKRRSGGRGSWGHYWDACEAIEDKSRELVRLITYLGGLLLIGGKF
jgi:hypothetical protein